MTKSDVTIEIRLLKIILWSYIVLCLLIAGLNYGYADRATPEIADGINTFWHIYENWIKTVFIIVGSILTLRIVAADRHSLRKKNLVGLVITALVVHIFGPLLFHNKELYFFTMPLPWTTSPLQLLETESSFYLSRSPVWGDSGITVSLIFYGIVTIIVFAGTVLFGRRWQCSTLCMFNGFAAEVFEPVFPLLGKKKHLSSMNLKIFSWARLLFLVIALGFTIWWILYLSGVSVPGEFTFIAELEVFKYLCTELLLMMFFWIVFSGRGYCYYCPLGTVLSLIGKVSGQRINTDRSRCVQCGQCNTVCPMSIDIKAQAGKGYPVRNLRCVGCGHCVDVCPTQTLEYSTAFLSIARNKAGKLR